MGMNLVIVAKKHIEAVSFGNSGGIASTASPFAEASRCVSTLFQDGGNGRFTGSQGCPTIVGTYRCMTRMFAGHEITAKRCAHRGACQSLSETDAFCGKLVDMGCANVGIAHMAQLIVGQFIGHEVHDVGKAIRCQKGGGKTQKENP